MDSENDTLPDVKNMWNDLTSVEVTHSPFVILERQITFLEKMTEGELTGEIDTEEFGSELIQRFFIVAPVLAGFRYELFRVTETISIYPLTLSAFPTRRKYACGNEKEFLAALEETLSSREVTAVAKNLYIRCIERNKSEMLPSSLGRDYEAANAPHPPNKQLETTPPADEAQAQPDPREKPHPPKRHKEAFTLPQNGLILKNDDENEDEQATSSDPTKG